MMQGYNSLAEMAIDELIVLVRELTERRRPARGPAAPRRLGDRAAATPSSILRDARSVW